MTNTDSDLVKANKAFDTLKKNFKTIKETGPEYMGAYVTQTLSFVSQYDEITPQNASEIRAGLRAAGDEHRTEIFNTLKQMDNDENGIGVLHDALHDAASVIMPLTFVIRSGSNS